MSFGFYWDNSINMTLILYLLYNCKNHTCGWCCCRMINEHQICVWKCKDLWESKWQVLEFKSCGKFCTLMSYRFFLLYITKKSVTVTSLTVVVHVRFAWKTPTSAAHLSFIWGWPKAARKCRGMRFPWPLVGYLSAHRSNDQPCSISKTISIPFIDMNTAHHDTLLWINSPGNWAGTSFYVFLRLHISCNLTLKDGHF